MKTVKKNIEMKCKGIFIKDEHGEMHNITDLEKPDYEDFLEMVHKLRIAYITVTH